MACAGRILVWWDRDFDSSGRPIRSDVRAAARELWEQACRQTIAALSDAGPAAELMENTVAQVSRYLDRTGAPLSSRKHGLVMIAFCRALGRYRAKSSRLELVGSSTDFGDLPIASGWVERADARLELEKLIRRLSQRSTEVLTLRAAGYEWEEIAELFETTAAAIRNSFWREIEKIRSSVQPRVHSTAAPRKCAFVKPGVRATRTDKSDVVQKARAKPQTSEFPRV